MKPRTDLPEVPEVVRRLAAGRGSANAAAPAVGGHITAGTRNKVLMSLAGTMRRRGFDGDAISAALAVTNQTRCRPPLDDGEVARIARSVSRYAPSDAAWQQSGEASSMTTADAAEISLRWWREEDVRPVRWAWEGRIPIGSLTSLTADGGMGKGTLAAWIAARLTRGELPGNYFGTPVTIFVIGTHEDGVGDTWVPRVKAAGGDVTCIASLETEFGREIDLVRDIKRIEALVEEHGFGFGYMDQVLDHFSGDSNSHIQQDVRRTLRPIQALARAREIGVMFTAHPSLASAGPRGIREGGSVQFGNVVRSALILGWHPELKGVRALARRKGNMGRVPPALTFTIEQATVVAPETGETVPTGTVSCPAEDDELRWENVLFSPPQERGETKVDVLERVMRKLGADGEWHSRREAEDACVDAGMSAGTFANKFTRMDSIETKTSGRETEWRLR
jgi:Primase C terminal 1 (PriCT-1)/AAA domain